MLTYKTKLSFKHKNDDNDKVYMRNNDNMY